MQRKGKEVCEEDRLYHQDKAKELLLQKQTKLTTVGAAPGTSDSCNHQRICFTDCGPTVHSMLFEPSMLLSRMCAAK